MRASYLRALRRVTRICAPCPVVRGAPSSDESRAPASWLRSFQNTCSTADDDYSIGWLGLLAGAALLLALGQGVGAAATITVTTNNPYIISDGQCSLIEAINNANNDAATFPDCAAGSGADTIVLPANANVTLSAVYAKTYGQFGDPVGLPPITSQITIEGNGATIARQGNAPAFGLMAVRGNVFQGVGVPPSPGGI